MRGHAKGVAAWGSPAFLSQHRPTGHAAVGVITSVPCLMAQNLYITPHCATCPASRTQGVLCGWSRHTAGVMQSFGPSGAAVVACTSSPVSQAHGLSCRAVAARPLGAPPFFYSQCGGAAVVLPTPRPPSCLGASRLGLRAGGPSAPLKGGSLHPRVLFRVGLHGWRSPLCLSPRHGHRVGKRARGPRSVGRAGLLCVTMGATAPIPPASANAPAQRKIKQ